MLSVGWEGENCDQIGSQAYTWIVIDAVLLIGTLGVLLSSVRLTYIALSEQTGRALFILGGGLRTLISWFACITFFFNFTGLLIFLTIEIFSPDEFGTLNFTYIGDLDKQGTYTPGTLFFLALTIFTFMINSLNLG